MNIALDLGTHRLKSLRHEPGRLIARSVRTAACLLDDTETIRRLLKEHQITWSRCQDRLVVLGDPAPRFALITGAPLVPLLPEGHLPEDPLHRQLLITLTESVLPQAEGPGAICCHTLPQPEPPLARPEREFLIELIRQRGWEPLPVSPPLAVVHAELAGESFTGIALATGALATDLIVTRQGRVLNSLRLPVGGTWIDRQVIQFLPDAPAPETEQLISRWKETCAGNVFKPTEPPLELLSNSYRLFLDEIWHGVRELLNPLQLERDLPVPVPLVMTGGPARIPGFIELCRESLRRRHLDLPVSPSEILVLGGDEQVITRGCLINAELEACSRQTRAA